MQGTRVVQELLQTKSPQKKHLEFLTHVFSSVISTHCYKQHNAWKLQKLTEAIVLLYWFCALASFQLHLNSQYPQIMSNKSKYIKKLIFFSFFFFFSKDNYGNYHRGVSEELNQKKFSFCRIALRSIGGRQA